MHMFLRFNWILYAIVTTLFVLSWRRRVPKARTGGPLAPLFWANLPWMLVGIGVLSGVTQTADDVVDLRIGLLAYAFISSVIALWVVLLRWILQRGGAELIAAHPPAGLGALKTADSVKLFSIACVLAGVVGLIANVVVAVQEPR